MTYFIDLVLSAQPREEAIRCIEHNAIDVADILVSMDDSSWNYDGNGTGFSKFVFTERTIRWRFWPIVPEIETKSGGAYKTEQVCLFSVLVGTARDTGFGHRDITHYR